MRALPQKLVLGLLALGISFSAHATVLMDAISVGGDTLHTIGTHAAGQSFVATSTGIGDVELALDRLSATTGSIVLTIDADSNDAPGSVLDTIYTLSEASIPLNAETLFDFNNLPITGLTVGSRYWLSVSKSGTTSTDVYITGNSPAVGIVSIQGQTGDTDFWKGTGSGGISASMVACISTDDSCGLDHPTGTAESFSESAPVPVTPPSSDSTTSVPEPASLTLLGLGFAGLGILRRHGALAWAKTTIV